MGETPLLPDFIPLGQPDQLTLTAALLLLLGTLALMTIIHRLTAGAPQSAPAQAFSQQLLQVGQWLAATPSDQEAIAATGQRAAERLLSPSRFALARLKDEQLSPLARRDQRDEHQAAELLRLYRATPELAQADEPVWRSGPDARQALITPVRSQAQVQGVFVAEFEPGAMPTDTAERLATNLAAWLGPVLERLAFREEAETRGGKLMLLGEISRRLITLRPLEERWNDVVPLLSQTFGFAEATIYEVTQDSTYPVARSHGGVDLAAAPDHDLPHRALHSRSTVRVAADGSGEPNKLAVPLMVEDHLLGVMTLERQPPDSFDDEEVALAEMLAGQLAIAALEAQNFSQQQEYTWYNTVMLEVARHAAQPGDPENALHSVLQLTTMLAGADWALLLLTRENPGQLQLGPSSGVPRAALDHILELELSASEFGLEAPYVESDSPFPVELPSPLDEALENSGALGMVLSDGNDLLGLLLVSGTSPSGPRKALIAGIGHQISLRIENAQLVEEVAGRRALERELETARSIQESFLPDQLPEVSGWELGATWLAARQVGGDFFDFIPLPEGDRGPRWGVVVADVADKGVPAALFMALCRTLVRSVAVSRADPGDLLTRTNELILADTRADLFVSLFYGVWEPDRPAFRYASAGHNPPILHHPDGRLQLLDEHGMVLGVSRKASYQTHQVELGFDSTLVLYTDGVTEAIDEQGAFFGVDRLSDIIRQRAKTTAQELAESINTAVREFCLTEDPPDDLTTVVLRHMPEERKQND